MLFDCFGWALALLGVCQCRKGYGPSRDCGFGVGIAGRDSGRARLPLAHDIDRADPKSRRWMCAYLNDGHDHRLFGPLGVDGLSSLVDVFGSQADGHIELKMIGSAA